MKKLFLTVILFLFVWNVSGADYQTTMIGEDLSKDFSINGWALSETSNQTDVTVKYYIEFVNSNYNHTEPEYFNLKLVDGDHLVAQKQLEVDRLDLGKNISGIVTISSEQPPDRINELEFESNHSMFKESGGKRNTVSVATIDFNPSKRDPEITDLESSTSIAERGQNISLKAFTKGIEKLSVNGNEMSENDGFFSGNVKIPEDTDAGETSVRYDFETGRGSEFTRTINITVNNEPPKINLSVNNSIRKGNPIKIKSDIEDDKKIVKTSLRFDGDSYELENGEATIETLQMYTGKYTLEVRAVDSDGAYSTETETIRLYRENKENISEQKNVTGKEVENISEDSAKNETSGSETETSREESSSLDEEDDGYMGFNELVVQPLKNFVLDLVDRF